MIDSNVPVRNSPWSGTGTVTVPSATAFCITTWLPRRLTSTKPCVSRIRQTSRPESTRSLANGDLDMGHIDLVPQAPVDFLGRGGLEEQG